VLAVDWVPSRPERPEGLIVVYDGGVLSAEEIAAIAVADDELAGFAFVPKDEVPALVSALLARRIAACLTALDAGTVAALENGSPTV
jgi:8-oxo-dGTP diphosphatase